VVGLADGKRKRLHEGKISFSISRKVDVRNTKEGRRDIGFPLGEKGVMGGGLSTFGVRRPSRGKVESLRHRRDGVRSEL